MQGEEERPSRQKSSRSKATGGLKCWSRGNIKNGKAGNVGPIKVTKLLRCFIKEIGPYSERFVIVVI